MLNNAEQIPLLMEAAMQGKIENSMSYHLFASTCKLAGLKKLKEFFENFKSV